MKKPWDAFEKDYIAVEHTDPDTGKTKIRYEYYGPWYLCLNGKAALKKAKRRAAAALLISAGASLWAGVLDSVLNLSGLTVIPYGLSLAALIFTASGVFSLLLSGERMKRTDYERMTRLLSIAPPVQSALLLLALTAGVYLSLSGQTVPGDIRLMAGYLLSGSAAASVYFTFKALQYRKEKNTEFEYADDVLTASMKTKNEVE